MRDEPIASVALFVRLEQPGARSWFSELERLFAIANRQLSHLAPHCLHSLIESQAPVDLSLNAVAALRFQF
jgi:hypothetical protein